MKKIIGLIVCLALVVILKVFPIKSTIYFIESLLVIIESIKP